MSVFGSRMQFEPMKELAFGSITGSYVAVGVSTDPAVRQYIVSNLTDAILGFSFDGVTDHFVMLPKSQFVSDITSNSSTSVTLLMAIGVSLYVKHRGSAPTTESVTFSTIYAYTAPSSTAS